MAAIAASARHADAEGGVARTVRRTIGVARHRRSRTAAARAARYHSGSHRQCFADERPAAAVLDYPFDAPPGARHRRSRSRPGVHWLRMPLPFALDHINLWLLEDDDGYDARRLRLRRRGDARALERHFATTLRGAPDPRASSPRTTIPTTSATRRGSRRASAAPVAMTQAEYLTAHAIVDGQRGLRAGADVCALFRRARHGGRARRGAGGARQSLPPRRAGAAARVRRGCIDGDTVDAGRTRVARDRRLRPLARARVARTAAERGVLIAGDMLLPRISTNVERRGPSSPTAIRSRASSIRSPRSRRCRRDTLVLPSHGLPFRGIALRVAQLRAHHAARLAELEDAHRGAPRAVSRRPTSCRCCSAASSTCSSASSRWARRSPISTTCGTRGRAQRSVATDGAIRFAA